MGAGELEGFQPEVLLDQHGPVAAPNLDRLWQAWAQGPGMEAGFSLADWGDTDLECWAFKIVYRTDRPVFQIDRAAIQRVVRELADKKGPGQKPPSAEVIGGDFIRTALLRSGWISHSNIEHVCSFIVNFDDVILCPDTNILLDCILSAILLPKLEAYEEPNWILVAIPKVVMAEIERWASEKFKTGHPLAGLPTRHGRLGQRGLQEILALDTSKEPKYRGLSIMTVGDLPPDFAKMSGDSVRKDSTIRRQFRDFLHSITFHKGAFLLSQDRVCVMMARAEGLQALYLQKPNWEDLTGAPLPQPPGVQLWRLMYELCVSFGRITVRHKDKAVQLSISWPGKHVRDWELAKLYLKPVTLSA